MTQEERELELKYEKIGKIYDVSSTVGVVAFAILVILFVAAIWIESSIAWKLVATDFVVLILAFLLSKATNQMMEEKTNE